MDLLEVKNISKTYGTGEATVHALKDATFSVPKGEFVAVVGESGFRQKYAAEYDRRTGHSHFRQSVHRQ